MFPAVVFPCGGVWLHCAIFWPLMAVGMPVVVTAGVD